MKIVGLVGESGTGKTTIAKYLERKGAGRIDADAIVHEILANDQAVQGEIRDRFGERVFRDGAVDRAELAKIVFADAGDLEALNGIIHPAVIEAIVARAKALEVSGCDYIVIDAALLLEVPLPLKIDLMLALRATREEQTKRLRALGGRSDAEIAARLDRQRHLEKSFDRADIVVDTNRPKDVVFAEVSGIINMLLDIEG
jgi:dephospho-CoA kinase